MTHVGQYVLLYSRLKIAATRRVPMRSNFLIAKDLGGPSPLDNPEKVGRLPEVINPQYFMNIDIINNVNHLITIISV